MTTLPNLGIVLPTRGAPGAGVWGDTEDANSALIDAHNHTTGKGVAVPTLGINIDADLTFSSAWAPTNLHRIQFASIAPLSGNNKSLFVADGTGGSTAGELYWRSNAGSNVKLTSGAALNVAAFTGGFGGDYASVGAAAAFDDSGDRYTFKQQSPGNWARIASGDLRLFETGTTDSVFVGLAAPAALASSYTITLPLAAPASTSVMQVSSAGVVTATNTIANDITMTANAHVTVSGTGDIKHGDRILAMTAFAGSGTNWSLDVSGTPVEMRSIGTGILGVPINLRVGDRIKSISFSLKGDGAADLVTTVYSQTAAMVATSIGTLTTSNQATSYSTITIDLTDTPVAAGDSLVATFNANASGLRIGGVSVTYDHP